MEGFGKAQDHDETLFFILNTVGRKTREEPKVRKHDLKYVLKGHSICAMVHRLEGGRSRCEKTNLGATAGTLRRDDGSVCEGEY